MQDASLVEVHERLAEVFQAKVIGPLELLALISTVGADTLTVTLLETLEPFKPLQVTVYERLEVRAPVEPEPDSPEPIPETEQELELLEDHEIVDEPL